MAVRRLRRSELATPASQERMIESAARSSADLVFLDLEDAVAPAEKDSARAQAVRALTELDWGAKTRAVRINDIGTPWAYQDVIDVVLGAGERVDVLIIPKVKAPRDVWWVETLLDQLEARQPRESPVGLEALIEEAEALARVEEIAGCSPRLETVILGFGDLSASLGARLWEEYPGDRWHYARGRVLAAARAGGIEPIDGPFGRYQDTDGYLEECRRARTLGFAGKWAIHPSQIAVANDTFSPTEQEVQRARSVVEAYRRAESEGAGAAGLEGALIDAAVVRIMQGILDQVELIEASGQR